MTSIGFYEARTHLSEATQPSGQGKKVLITHRAKPAALLSPQPRMPIPARMTVHGSGTGPICKLSMTTRPSETPGPCSKEPR
jgi:antitoxin (DNA-binding transcriptional repressor) of toxin-antitoxin stability system